MKIFSKIILFFLAMFFLNISCNNPENKIPYVYVDFTIDINKPEFFELNAIGNSLYVTGGVSGIVVYRDSRDEFFAYDRACPYDPECGRVVLDKDGYNLVDSCCGSRFSMSFDGAVLQGPAELPLRKYNTYYYVNSNQLRITSNY